MGAKTVRAAIRDFFTDTPGLTNVFKDEPWLMTGDDWTKDGAAGTVAYVHLDQQTESRITIPALTGQKSVTWDCGLVVLYRYQIPSEPDGKDAWVDGLDDLLDALVEKIREHPTLDASRAVGGPVFEAGQSDQGIRIGRDLPKRELGFIHSWNVLHFTLTEIVTA